MSLPDRLIVRPLPHPVNGAVRWAVALVCSASAGVHAALVPEHFEERPVLGWAFLLSVVLLAAAAVRLVADPSPAAWVPVVLGGVAAAYLLSRTVGLPVLVPEPEPADLLGVLTTLAEVVAALLALASRDQGKEPR